MNLTTSSLLSLVVETLRNPREGASAILSMTPPRAVLWQALALVVVISVLMSRGVEALFPPVAGELAGPFSLSPFALVMVQGGLLLVMVFATLWIGRALGGTGSLEETLFLVTWLQFIMICIQVLQVVALIVMPVFAGIVGIAALALFLWLFVNFVSVLHGFPSLLLVFVGIVVSAFAVVFGLSLILALIGVTVPGAFDV